MAPLGFDYSGKFTTENNIYLTKELFLETTLADKTRVLYTLKDKDHRGFPSLYKLYMEMEDVTEWEFATTYLGGWEHWQKLLKSKWFDEYISRWRHELELKLKARHLRLVKEAAEGEGKDKLAANKYLLDKGYAIKVEGPGRGRPSKQEINKRADEIAAFEDSIKSDFERMKEYH